MLVWLGIWKRDGRHCLSIGTVTTPTRSHTLLRHISCHPDYLYSQLQITGASFTVPADPLTLGFIPCTSGCPWYNNICNGDGVNPSANNFSMSFSISTSTYTTAAAARQSYRYIYRLNYPVTSQAVAISLADACLLTNLTSSTATVLVTGPAHIHGCSSDATGSITVSAVPLDTMSYTDSVHIYASPDSPVIAIAKDSICNGDSTLLNIGSAYAGYGILWYQDTTFISRQPVTQHSMLTIPVTIG